MKRGFGDLLGAFCDLALYFPIVSLYADTTGASEEMLFISTAIVLIVSSFVFRIPMAVQPLKALTLSAVTMGASLIEVRVAGISLGVLCLLCLFPQGLKLLSQIPRWFIHNLQFALGLMLVVMAITEWRLAFNSPLTLGILGLAVLICLQQETLKLPILGMIAITGLMLSSMISGAVDASSLQRVLRMSVVPMLIIPQFILTISNSVLATHQVSHKYFGENASRVTIKRLLLSIGIGNLFTGLAGGLPFCHGAGGVTAHYRGGSRTVLSNWILASFFLLLALCSLIFHKSFLLHFPPSLRSILLMTIGVFHLLLAKESFKSSRLRYLFGATGAFTFFFHSLLVAPVVGVLYALIPKHKLGKTP